MSNDLGDLKDANFPRDAEGRVYHLAVKKGQIANRIVTCGDVGRAKILKGMFDNPNSCFVVQGARGFYIATGMFNGVPVSVIASMMGFPNIDFVIREVRATVDGDIAIVRFGSCGTPAPEIAVGRMVVATDGCVGIYRNPDAFRPGASPSLEKYHITEVAKGDDKLHKLLYAELEDSVGKDYVFGGINSSGCSFYSSQGRKDDNFDDDNQEVLDKLMKKYPNTVAIEMETFHLFDVAEISKGTIKAAGMALTLAQRKSNDFLSFAKKHALEQSAGFAALAAVSKYDIPEERLHKENCVWDSYAIVDRSKEFAEPAAKKRRVDVRKID